MEEWTECIASQNIYSMIFVIIFAQLGKTVFKWSLCNAFGFTGVKLFSKYECKLICLKITWICIAGDLTCLFVLLLEQAYGRGSAGENK